MAQLQPVFDGENAATAWFPLRFQAKQMTGLSMVQLENQTRKDPVAMPCKNMGASL